MATCSGSLEPHACVQREGPSLNGFRSVGLVRNPGLVRITMASMVQCHSSSMRHHQGLCWATWIRHPIHTMCTINLVKPFISWAYCYRHCLDNMHVWCASTHCASRFPCCPTAQCHLDCEAKARSASSKCAHRINVVIVCATLTLTLTLYPLPSCPS